MLKTIIKRLSGATLVVASLAIAATLVRSDPQDPPSPLTNPEPAVAVAPAQPAPIVDYKPAVVKPVANGHFEKRYIEGAWRFVWFADGVKKSPVVQKKTYSSGGCANGSCSRGWGRRR